MTDGNRCVDNELVFLVKRLLYLLEVKVGVVTNGKLRVSPLCWLQILKLVHNVSVGRLTRNDTL